MEIKKNLFKVGIMIDLMEGCESWEIKIGEHGICALMDVMPRLVPPGRTGDMAIVQAARTSTGGSVKSNEEDRKLVRYLYGHNHTTPFEMVNFKFYHVLPIFVARQLIRHRTASVNEFSGRYAEVKDRFWIPQQTDVRGKGGLNKQGSVEPVNIEIADSFIADLIADTDGARSTYEWALQSNIANEIARVGLPLNTFTEWVWEIDLKNLLGFLGLRQDHHAQKEIRDYADAMYELIKPIVPWAIEAYDDFSVFRGGMALSREEIIALSDPSTILGWSKRQLTEFKEKAERLGNMKAVNMVISLLQVPLESIGPSVP